MAFYVCMTDKFMSGWGMARDKTNIYCVECDTYEQAEQIEQAAQRRSEMKRIRINSNPPRSTPRNLITRKHYNDLGGPWKE